MNYGTKKGEKLDLKNNILLISKNQLTESGHTIFIDFSSSLYIGTN
jgi:hypothetical protein